jgi:hypothetical protein
MTEVIEPFVEQELDVAKRDLELGHERNLSIDDVENRARFDAPDRSRRPPRRLFISQAVSCPYLADPAPSFKPLPQLLARPDDIATMLAIAPLAIGSTSDQRWIMSELQIQSVEGFQGSALLEPLVALLVKAEVMGLLKGKRIRKLCPQTVRAVLHELEADGIGTNQRLRLLSVLEPSTPAAADAALAAVTELLQALEESPVPKREWPSMLAVFGEALLGELLEISAVSVRRYGSGARETPDDVADRLHFLAMLVADLAGSYNELGIRRWLDRPRGQLANKSPRQVLGKGWHSGSGAALRVREHARSLTSGGAT